MNHLHSLTLSLALSVFVMASNGQIVAQDNSCYPHDNIQSRKTITLRENPVLGAKTKGYTDSGVAYNVLETRKIDGNCWVSIDDGWILYKRTETPREEANTSQLDKDVPVEHDCYQNNRAYLTGIMNIREQPTTNSAKVGMTSKGETYRVWDTHEGEDYCWLNISTGWIAHINQVSDDIERVLPAIDQGHQYTSKIIAAFKTISRKSITYFNYIAPAISTIEIVPSLGVDNRNKTVNATMYVKERRLVISEQYLRRAPQLDVAIMLAHEACHVHQWDRGDRYIMSFQAEPECIEKEADVLSALSPGHPDIKVLRCYAERYPLTAICRYS